MERALFGLSRPGLREPCKIYYEETVPVSNLHLYVNQINLQSDFYQDSLLVVVAGAGSNFRLMIEICTLVSGHSPIVVFVIFRCSVQANIYSDRAQQVECHVANKLVLGKKAGKICCLIIVKVLSAKGQNLWLLNIFTIVSLYLVQMSVCLTVMLQLCSFVFVSKMCYKT